MENKSIVKTSLDKTDYMLCASCGLIAGIIDVIFVGDPNNSILGEVTDKAADNFVVKAAQFFWKNDGRSKNKPKKMPDSLHKSISYLEQAFPVKYDARYAADLKVDEGVLANMAPSNHHLLSLSHSPDVIGLVFTIIEQFSNSGTAAFIDNGKIINVVPNKLSKNNTPYLYGKNPTAKLFCGFINWIGHLISDVSGSSSTRDVGKTGRGAGIPMPFYEMFLTCEFGNFDGNSFADTMIEVFEKGYDFRFGIATAIPVVINELLLRATWVLRQKLYYKRDWKECLPSSKNADFRTMLLVGSTTFSVVDGADAAIRAIDFKEGFNWVGYFSRVNYVGVARLTELIVKECIIRASIAIGKNADKYVDNIFGMIPDEEKAKMIVLYENVKSYLDYLDFKKAIKQSLIEYKEAKENRINIEQEAIEYIEQIMEMRQAMYLQMEKCFCGYLVAFDTGIELMDQGVISNDSDTFIQGNTIIQDKLGRDAQFRTQNEFDSLMDSDDDFRF